jgi:hypothetical protein
MGNGRQLATCLIAIVFSLLNKGKPMIDYEDFQPLYEFLKLRSNPISLMGLVGKL